MLSLSEGKCKSANNDTGRERYHSLCEVSIPESEKMKDGHASEYDPASQRMDKKLVEYDLKDLVLCDFG